MERDRASLRGHFWARGLVEEETKKKQKGPLEPRGAEMTYLVTFTSHFDAILANRTLKSAGLRVQLMPVPRTVSASCGTCVTFQLEAGDTIPVGVQQSQPHVEHVYRQEESGWELIQ